ncbi:hypothetical protein TNCT_358571 [Trichonephila clavata]|uniref:Uncharacterized protein n=1 Tax=Trichonephila clavata TaxID=2740835 RepID=A0A8X6KRR3_TRICU|nr:hypothetical protein TNCT_358571 [Trichonephila clavata]
MTATLTLSESFISDMDWEDTQVHVEEMEWETICTYDSEPMDWEDIPQVRAFKRSKVSEPVECNIPLQVKAAPPASKKVSPPPNLTSLQENATPPQPKKVIVTLDPKPNPTLQVTPPTPQKVSPFSSEFIRHKIRSKPKLSIPEVSAPTDRVILKARKPALPRI